MCQIVFEATGHLRPVGVHGGDVAASLSSERFRATPDLRLRLLWSALVAICSLTIGCGRGANSDPRADEALARAGVSKEQVFPLAGKVLIDGEPALRPTKASRIVVMLYDRTPGKRSPHPFAECNEQGEFSFRTYSAGDGVVAGDYVVVIAQLTFRRQSGHSGPDGLKNLYNDPDKNANQPNFCIAHASPGKSDYVFELNVRDREKEGQPGPNALTAIP